MRLSSILISIILTISLCLFACSPSAEQENVTVDCEDFTKVNHLKHEVTVKVDDSLTVTLCSNPSTGFQWAESAQIDDQTSLEQLNFKYEAPEGDVPGAPGLAVWTFKALEKGQAIVSMEYSQPWEGGTKAEWTFELTVTVK
ncbi:MAG: protease inhibitor I42 family protein [Dehalococcoidales bacterium]|nr:MAG: protease inhibitor I42 family protein [Dehalococcoidales bacterium]